MASKKYNMTFHGVMNWAKNELVGYLIGVKDKDIQYSYAQLNGMLHLRDALLELVQDEKYAHHKEELLRVHDKVVRVVKHLINDFDVNLEDIKRFNTRKVLSNLSYLTRSNTKARKNKNSRKNRY